MEEGKVRVKRVPVMFVGQERTGKTSLKKSLKGKTFDKWEESTDGIEADPSYFEVSTEIWKTGEKMVETDPDSSIWYDHLAAAKLIHELLRKEEGNVLDVSESQVEQPSTSSIHLVSKLAATDLTKQVEELLQKGENAKDDDIYSILWDFRGQSVFYDTHPIFLTEKAIYILVSDLSRNPYEKAIPPVRKGLYRNNVDIDYNKTNLDYLDYWMSSIYSLVSPDVMCSQDTAANAHETLPRRLPPVFLVCTHADKPYLTAKGTTARDLALEIYGNLRSHIYGEHLFKDVFVVDNTMSGSDHECPDVARLREEILALSKELPLVKEEIPLKWMRYENTLQIFKKRFKWIPLDEAKRIARDEYKIDDGEEFSTLLNFLHDQRIVVHFWGSPELETMVILDPPWLVDVFEKIITINRYEHSEAKLEILWLKLEDTGILDERLIDHTWKHLFDNQERPASLIAIMERLNLLFSYPSTDPNKQYLVPSMLMSHPTDDVIKLLDSVKVPSLFVRFASGRVPPGLFSRLILLFLKWCNEKWSNSTSPLLFHDFAMFHILPDQGISVILLCHSSSIEIIVYSGDNEYETTAACTRGNCDVSTSRSIHWKLRLILEYMREEFHWFKNIKYEMCVCCPVCSQPGSAKCRAHDVRGCPCIHLLSESDLQKRQHCNRPGRNIREDCRIRINQFSCWFSFGEKEEREILVNQHQAVHGPDPGDDVDEKHTFSSEGTKQKLFALPEGVMNSIQSQASDPKDIVIQFQETLQLDPASLKHPDPETKQWIRCLASKAQWKNRVDVVKCLREITPAGTTGPLLNEDLVVRRMPSQKYKDLTSGLSGGDEWKLLAETLGLSETEIRFCDKRVLNPCDVILRSVGNHRYLSVGEIYDTLVDCELPAIADLM